MPTIYRDKFNGKIAGVFAGLGEHFEIDANILRVIAILLAIFTGLAPVILLAYIVMIFLMPKKPPHLYGESLRATFDDTPERPEHMRTRPRSKDQ